MGSDTTEVTDAPISPQSIKVHLQMCTELIKFVNRASKLLPEIEASRPRCTSGLDSLCMLNNTIVKAKSIIQCCSESSKLYLALTGEAILSRCKKSTLLLEQSLSQMQYMVPVMLAAEISVLVGDLREARFRLEPSEEEAGKVVKDLLHKYTDDSSPTRDSTLAAIQVAMSMLDITTPKALLAEKRSIRMLLDKSGDSEESKRKILFFFLNILNNYEKRILKNPEDPRIFGDLISKRSTESGPVPSDPESISSVSIDSLGSSMNDLQLPTDFTDSSIDGLDSLSWESQCRVVESIGKCGDENLERFPRSLMRFLNGARESRDENAQISGCRLLSSFLKKCRTAAACFDEKGYETLASFLTTAAAPETLAVFETLSSHPQSHHKIAASGALNLLPGTVSAENKILSRRSLTILKNLCGGGEDARAAVGESEGCVSAVVKVLKSDDPEVQEHALAVLLSLCSRKSRYCELVMSEDVVPDLFCISVNGNNRGKKMAAELLRILRDDPCVAGDGITAVECGGNGCAEREFPSPKKRGFIRKLFLKIGSSDTKLKK